MTLDEAKKEFESRFAVVKDGKVGAITENGTPYVSCCLGVKAEGAQSPFMATSKEGAVQAWLAAAKEYAAAHPGNMLLWRTPPEIDFEEYRTEAAYKRALAGNAIDYDRDGLTLTTLWLVYSRFAIEGSAAA